MSLAITNNAWFHLLSVTALSLVLSSDSYKPVIIIHGILDGAEQMMDLKKLIEAVKVAFHDRTCCCISKLVMLHIVIAQTLPDVGLP